MAVDADGSGDPEPATPDQQLQTQRGHANTTSTANGGKGVQNTSSNPTSQSSDGPVTVAAAISLIVADVSSLATVPVGRSLVAGGAVVLRSSQNVDAISTADGRAVQGGSGSGGCGDIGQVCYGCCTCLGSTGRSR